MAELTKGEQTRLEILERVNDLFNTKGLNLTIAEIASSVGLGKSRITNYFPKKENLISGLLREYEELKTKTSLKYESEGEITDFSTYIVYMSEIMDLMFRYRGVISYAMINSTSDAVVRSHMKLNYNRDTERIRNRIKVFSREGLVSKSLLEEDKFSVFAFHFLCMASNWIITYDLIDSDKELAEVKPRYLQSIFCCLQPFLTQKGNRNMNDALRSEELANAQSR